MSAWGGVVVSGRDAGAQIGQSCTPSTAEHSKSWTGKTRRSSFEAEDNWTAKLRHDWAIPLEQLANRSHRRDTQHFNLQEQTQNISIQTVSLGRIFIYLFKQLVSRHNVNRTKIHTEESQARISHAIYTKCRIETLYQLRERLCDGLAIKKRYTNVLYITFH